MKTITLTALLLTSSALAAPITLPDTPETRTPVSLTLPPGGLALDTALSAIGKSAKLTIVARGLPTISITAPLKNMAAGEAISTLLNIYGDGLGAQLRGKTLLIAPQEVLDRLNGSSTQVRTQVLDVALTDEAATKLVSLVPGVKAVAFGSQTVLTGDARSVQQAADLARRLAPTAPAAPVTVTASLDLGALDATQATSLLTGLYPIKAINALGRLYVSGSPADVDAARVTLEQAKATAPKPVGAPVAALAAPVVQRTYTSTLDAAALAQLAGASGVTVSALPDEALQASGTASQLDSFSTLLTAANARDATRTPVTYKLQYQGADDLTTALRVALPSATVTPLPGARAVIVRGTDTDQVLATKLLAKLDVPTLPSAGDLSTQVLRLNYLDAKTAATNLASLITDKSVTVIPDDRSQSLVLNGPSDRLEALTKAVIALDQPLPNIRVQVRVEQLNDSDGSNFGLAWKAGIGGLSVGSDGTGLSVGYAPTVSPVTLQASLNAAQSTGRAKTLLNTSFAVQTGRTSAFNGGGTLTFAPTSSTSSTGQTTTTPGQTVPYGLNVNLTPRLASDGRVELTVSTALGGKPTSGPQNSILIDTQSLNTVVSLAPGQTMYLGGLISDETTDTKTGVPILSQIPIIGALFTKTVRSTTHSSILVILTAQKEDGTPAVASKPASAPPTAVKPATALPTAAKASPAPQVSAPTPVVTQVPPAPAPSAPASQPRDNGASSTTF